MKWTVRCMYKSAVPTHWIGKRLVPTQEGEIGGVTVMACGRNLQRIAGLGKHCRWHLRKCSVVAVTKSLFT